MCLCVWMCVCVFMVVFGLWQPNAIPSRTHTETPQHRSKDTGRHPRAFTSSLAPSSRFLITVPISPPLPQSPGGCSWETTLLDAPATPDDHLSPLCPPGCPATCPVLRSKQSLTFTHVSTPNHSLLVRSLSALILFCVVVAHLLHSLAMLVVWLCGWQCQLAGLSVHHTYTIDKNWIDWHNILSRRSWCPEDDYPLTFNLVQPWGWHLWFWIK